MSEHMFKKKHPGVPTEWRSLGEGGNAVVWSDGKSAVKRLKTNTSQTARDRFRREAEILRRLQGQADLRVVDVSDIRTREGALEIVMERMDGTLLSSISQFAGDPIRAARAMEPLARTLSCLSALPQPVFHRDLKPSNLLFKGSADHLLICDFGCAFVGNDPRLTPIGRAMGAWKYRPPEYENGPLEEVTEKGDVFSLGKIFWQMIAGEESVTFPGSLWHLPEFDLTKIFPKTKKVAHAMLIISKAVAVDQSRRPSMNELAEMLVSLCESIDLNEETEKQISRMKKQNEMEIKFEQRRRSTSNFVSTLYDDFREAIFRLYDQNPEDLLWKHWRTEALKPIFNAERLIKQVAENESDAPLISARFHDIRLNSRFYPASSGQSLKLVIGVSAPESNISSQMAISDLANGLSYERYIAAPPARIIGEREQGERKLPYNSRSIMQFLIQATDCIFSE